MKYFGLFVFTVSFLGACDPGDESLGDTGTEGGASSTGASTVTLGETEPGSGSGGGSSSGGTTSDLTSGADTGSTAGSGTTQGTGEESTTGNPACENDPLPAEEAALVTISIELTNDTAEPTYVIASAQQCTGLSVAREGTSLNLANAYSCGCECPGAGPAGYTTIALDPGMTHIFSWDGREMAPYQTREDCFDGEFCGADTRGVPQLVEPGPVTFTIPLYDEAADFEDFGVFGFQDRCVSPTTFTVDVELGTEDQLIPVALSDL